MTRSFVAPVVLLLFASAALAQTPDRLDRYRVLPRFSRVQESGGWLGDIDYSVNGAFGFARTDLAGYGASFPRAELWGSIISEDPVIAVVLDVDQAFHLTDLHGELLPTGGPFDVYQFQGSTSDGARVQLFAALQGPWMYLRGVAHAPRNTNDYPEYSIQALARSGHTGDFNGDGTVDARDYTVWRDAMARGGTAADGNNDGRVDREDYQAWRDQFGERAPDVSSMDAAIAVQLSAQPLATPAPEPAAVLLILLAAGPALPRRR